MNTRFHQILSCTILLLLISCASALSRTVQSGHSVRRPLDDADLNATPDIIAHDVGSVRCTISNYGELGNPNSVPGYQGFEFPIDSGNDFLFSAGIWVGAQVDGESRVSTTTDGDNGTGEFRPVHIGSAPSANTVADPDWFLLSSTLTSQGGREYVRGRHGVDDDGDWNAEIDDLNGDSQPTANFDGGGGFLNFDDDQDGVVDEESANGQDDDGDGLSDEDTHDGDANGDGDAGYDPEPHIDEDFAGDMADDRIDNDHDSLVDMEDLDFDGDCCPGIFDDDGDGVEDEDAAARAEQEYYCVFQDSIEQMYVSYPDENHRPLDIEVAQRSYEWNFDLVNSIVLVDYTVRNCGSQILENVQLAFFADPDIGAQGEGGDAASLDDQNYFDAERSMMVQYDDLDDADGTGPGVFAVKVVKPPVPWSDAVFTFANFERVSGGDPSFDTDKFALMSSGTISPPVESFGDWRMLMAWGAADGALTLQPGETIRFTVAMIGALDTAAVNALADRLPVFDAGPQIGDITLYTSPTSLGPYVLSIPISDEDGVNWESGVHINWLWHGHESQWNHAPAYSYVWDDPETCSGEYYFLIPDTHADSSLVSAGDTIIFYCDAQDGFGNYSVHTKYSLIAGDTLLDAPQRSKPPADFTLHQNYPNPFNGTTTIAYDLSQAGHISLRVFDLLGREVSVLADEFAQAGIHRVNFDGSGFSSGIYFARLDAGAFSETKKLMLLK